MQYQVHRAGERKFNGVYKADGKYKGRPKFTKEGTNFMKDEFKPTLKWSGNSWILISGHTYLYYNPKRSKKPPEFGWLSRVGTSFPGRLQKQQLPTVTELQADARTLTSSFSNLAQGGGTADTRIRRKITVVNAGTVECNGIYGVVGTTLPNGHETNRPVYRKDGSEWHVYYNSDSGWIIQSSSPGHGWYIREHYKLRFYRQREDTAEPAPDGWEAVRSGKGPAPTLVHGTMGLAEARTRLRKYREETARTRRENGRRMVCAAAKKEVVVILEQYKPMTIKTTFMSSASRCFGCGFPPGDSCICKDGENIKIYSAEDLYGSSVSGPKGPPVPEAKPNSPLGVATMPSTAERRIEPRASPARKPATQAGAPMAQTVQGPIPITSGLQNQHKSGQEDNTDEFWSDLLSDDRTLLTAKTKVTDSDDPSSESELETRINSTEL